MLLLFWQSSASPQTLTPSAVATAASVATPTVLRSAYVVTPSPVVAVVSFVDDFDADPVIIYGGRTLTPSAVVASVGVFNPTILGDVIVLPSPIAAVASVALPTVVKGARLLTPIPVVIFATVAQPLVIGGEQNQAGALYFRYK